MRHYTGLAVVPRELTDSIEAMRRPVVIGHVRPDADCLGSMLALARGWPAAGGSVWRACLPVGSVSARLQFLLDWAQVPVVGPDELDDADGFIVLDTATKGRCGVGAEAPDGWSDGRRLVNIDHHRTNSRFGRVNWVVPESASTAELVYLVLRAAGREVDQVTASLLFAGVHADTRGFTVADSTGASLTVAARLVEAKARVAEVAQRLYRGRRTGEFELLRVIYANTHVAAGGRIAHSSASYDEITACGCTAADIDEQVDVPRSLGGIEMAILLTEGVPGKVRVNLRGETGVSVLELAQELGGGGHEQAAGAVLDGTISRALERVLSLARKHLG